MGNVYALVRYEAACRALAEAKSIDEVKGISDKAEAMRAYAHQAKNKGLETDAAEIRIRAERRLGELIKAQKDTTGLNRGGGPGRGKTGAKRAPVLNEPPTLSETGIDKKLSSRAQKLAAVPEEQFEEMVGRWRDRIEEENQRVTVNLLRAGKRATKRVDTLQEDTCTVADLDSLVAQGRKFGAIYADPPWLYSNQGTRAATSNHYGGMTVEQICALPIGQLADADAHLHLWITNGFLFEAPKIFAAWGFEFRSSFVWVKPQIGIGNYWRNSHEILLTAIRGNAKRFHDKSLKSWMQCDRGAHSQKPEQVRSFIERASSGPYLELFGRRAAPGWTVWGNEIERDVFTGGAQEVA